jgi:hypothetical protein
MAMEESAHDFLSATIDGRPEKPEKPEVEHPISEPRFEL